MADEDLIFNQSFWRKLFCTLVVWGVRVKLTIRGPSIVKSAINRIKNGLVLSLAAATLCTAPGLCGEELVPGYVAKNKIQQVATGIEWNTDLNAACEKAKRANKMILWINMIGKMEGAT